jgi:hypothetical protein
LRVWQDISPCSFAAHHALDDPTSTSESKAPLSELQLGDPSQPNHLAVGNRTDGLRLIGLAAGIVVFLVTR